MKKAGCLIPDSAEARKLTSGPAKEGLLYNEDDRLKVLEKFRRERVDGLFLPHCNFGTEYVCARLAKDLGVPVLLWGPLDERPEENGVRLRDTQCGLFATGKVLRRFRVPFTCLTNCRLNDPVFERGVRDFLAVCNVVKTFKQIRILQIGPRPFDFWSTICNEGELLEMFHVQLAPVPLPELTAEVKKAISDGTDVRETIAYCRENIEINVTEEQLTNIAGLAVTMERLIKQYHCNAGAIQCWYALQSELGIMPCAANALLNGKGIPIVCETDIHGAITALLAEAAANDGTRGFFADWTIRHPDIANGELLQHCGPWPLSVAGCKLCITYPLAFDYPGAITAESRFIGHPSNKVPGIEVNSGSLGHGLPVAVGMAKAGKMQGADWHVYTLIGDGELAEGSIWEGTMAGSHFKLDNLTALVDRNRLQISGSMEDVMAQDSQEARWAAFGWLAPQGPQ